MTLARNVGISFRLRMGKDRKERVGFKDESAYPLALEQASPREGDDFIDASLPRFLGERTPSIFLPNSTASTGNATSYNIRDSSVSLVTFSEIMCVRVKE